MDHVGKEGRTGARADRHGRPGPAPVGAGIRPSPAGCRGRGLPPAPARRQAGAQVYGKNHGGPAGHDLSAGGLCQRPHPEKQHEPGKGEGLLPDAQGPAGHLCRAGQPRPVLRMGAVEKHVHGPRHLRDVERLLSSPSAGRQKAPAFLRAGRLPHEDQAGGTPVAPLPGHPPSCSPMCRTSSPC